MESSDNPFQEDYNGFDLEQILEANLLDINDIDCIINLDSLENLLLPSTCQITTTASNSNSRAESSVESESDSLAWAEPSTSASYSPPSRAGPQVQGLQPEPYVTLDVPPNATSPYRYERDLKIEKRNSGVIPGPRGTSESATDPAIKLHNYSGHDTRRPLVVVSCITDEAPDRAHPNKLFGGRGIIEIVGGMGVGYIKHNNEFSLCKVGIVRVRKDEIKESLQERAQAEIRNLSSSHIFPLQNGVDLELGYNTTLLRLAFHVFLPVGEDGWLPLQPVISDVVRLVKSNPATSQLEIDEIYPVVGSTEGGTMIIIYIKKGNVHNNLRVVFIEEDERGWEEDAHIKKIKNRTIVVLAPKYEGRPTSPGGRARVSVYVCDMAGERVSDAVPFYFQRSRLPAHAQDSASPDALQEMRPKRVCMADSTNKEANEAPAPPVSTVEESQYIPDANAIEVMKKFGFLKL